jgi:very-short-patch-repair endonuclease
MLERFQDELRGSTAAFKSENFGLALWSLVVLGSLEDASPLVESLTRALVDINRGVLSSPDALSDTTLCSLYMARLVARESPFESLVSLSTDAVADDCERAWIGMKSKDPTYSNLQHAIAEELREFGVHGFTLETPVEGGRMRPDIVFENHRVVVEVDGPHHYSYDALGRRRALGTTVMRDKLLESWGWRVRVIPYHEWADLLSSDEKRAYLRQLLGDDVFDGNAA